MLKHNWMLNKACAEQASKWETIPACTPGRKIWGSSGELRNQGLQESSTVEKCISHAFPDDTAAQKWGPSKHQPSLAVQNSTGTSANCKEVWVGPNSQNSPFVPSLATGKISFSQEGPSPDHNLPLAQLSLQSDQCNYFPSAVHSPMAVVLAGLMQTLLAAFPNLYVTAILGNWTELKDLQSFNGWKHECMKSQGPEHLLGRGQEFPS